MSPKAYRLWGDLVTGHPWRIHLIECSGGVATVRLGYSLNTLTYEILAYNQYGATYRTTVTTRTMCGVIENLTKGLSSRYCTTTVPLYEK